MHTVGQRAAERLQRDYFIAGRDRPLKAPMPLAARPATTMPFLNWLGTTQTANTHNKPCACDVRTHVHLETVGGYDCSRSAAEVYVKIKLQGPRSTATHTPFYLLPPRAIGKRKWARPCAYEVSRYLAEYLAVRDVIRQQFALKTAILLLLKRRS